MVPAVVGLTDPRLSVAQCRRDDAVCGVQCSNVPVVVVALRLPPANFSNRFAVKQTNHNYVHNITNLDIDGTRAHELSLNAKTGDCNTVLLSPTAATPPRLHDWRPLYGERTKGCAAARYCAICRC